MMGIRCKPVLNWFISICRSVGVLGEFSDRLIAWRSQFGRLTTCGVPLRFVHLKGQCDLAIEVICRFVFTKVLEPADVLPEGNLPLGGFVCAFSFPLPLAIMAATLRMSNVHCNFFKNLILRSVRLFVLKFFLLYQSVTRYFRNINSSDAS